MGIRDAWRALVGRKESAVGSFISFGQTGRPAWTPRRYDRLAAEGYQANVIAFRCISEISRGAASVPFKLMRGDDEITSHPLLTLIARPNPVQGQFEFFEALHAYGQIAGNAYAEVVNIGGRPGELWLHRPDRMAVIPGPSGVPSAYEFSHNNRKFRWEVNPSTGLADIMHIKRFHPLNDWYGMSPIEAAAASIDQHNEAGAWNKAMLERGARPSGVLAFKHGDDMTLDDGAIERLRTQVDDMMSGGKNAGRPLVLEGGLDWREMGLSPKDMDWLQGIHNSSRDIANAFGCPPQILSLPGDSVFANMKEARLWMWEQVIIPVLDSASTEMNRWLVPRYGDRALRLVPDLDEVPALAPRRESVWARVQEADFLTINEKRAAVGLGEVDGGDDILIDAGKVPLTFDGAAEPSDDEAEKAAAVAYGNPEFPKLASG